MEIATLQSVDHENVVRLRESFTAALPGENFSRGLYIVMDLSLDGTLADRIKSKINWKENEVKIVVRSILRGLSHLHNLSIIHCDLKPANVLCSKSLDVIQLTDLGLSRWVFGGDVNENTNKESKPIIRGTIGYVAPEVVFKGSFSREADIWSVGVITHELLRGKLPFSWRSVAQMKRICASCKDFSFLWEKENCSSSHESVKRFRLKDVYNKPRSRGKSMKSVNRDSLPPHSSTPAMHSIDKLLKLSDKVWMERSENSRDFVQYLLAPIASERLSADDALSNGWFADYFVPDKNVSSNCNRTVKHITGYKGLPDRTRYNTIVDRHLVDHRPQIMRTFSEPPIRLTQNNWARKSNSSKSKLSIKSPMSFHGADLKVDNTLKNPVNIDENESWNSSLATCTEVSYVYEDCRRGTGHAKNLKRQRDFLERIRMRTWVAEPWKTVQIRSGACFDLVFEVKANCPIMWDWKIIIDNPKLASIYRFVPSMLTLDIKFTVYFESEISARKKAFAGSPNRSRSLRSSRTSVGVDHGFRIFPMRSKDRNLVRHTGCFEPPVDGTLTLLWDNMQSVVWPKTVSFRSRQCVQGSK